MPDVYVFPGGTLDRQDWQAAPASGPGPGLLRHAATGKMPRKARALAMAAVREAWEETGLVLGLPADVGPLTHPSWHSFRQMGLAPDLRRLAYVGRAITPTESPLRFHARFFAVEDTWMQGELRGDRELLDLRWVSLAGRARFPMVDVTEFMFLELQRMLETKRGTPPLLCYRGEAVVLRYGQPAR